MQSHSQEFWLNCVAESLNRLGDDWGGNIGYNVFFNPGACIRRLFIHLFIQVSRPFVDGDNVKAYHTHIRTPQIVWLLFGV